MNTRTLRGPELAAHVRRGMDEIARDAGYTDAAAMCRRLARQGQAYLASPYAAARDTLDALRAELTTPVPEWRGGTDPDSVTERRREALRGVA